MVECSLSRRSNTRTEPSAETEAKMPTPPQAMSYTCRSQRGARGSAGSAACAACVTRTACPARRQRCKARAPSPGQRQRHAGSFVWSAACPAPQQRRASHILRCSVPVPGGMLHKCAPVPADLLVMRNQLRVHHAALHVPDGASRVDGAGADAARVQLVPVKGGEGRRKLAAFVLRAAGRGARRGPAMSNKA